VKRRDFLKVAGAAVATVVAPVPLIPAASPTVPWSLGAPLILFPTSASAARAIALRYSGCREMMLVEREWNKANGFEPKFSAATDPRRDA